MSNFLLGAAISTLLHIYASPLYLSYHHLGYDQYSPTDVNKSRFRAWALTIWSKVFCTSDKSPTIPYNNFSQTFIDYYA